jgi:peptide/nickel transport system permease protein
VLAIGFAMVAPFARLTRGEVLRVRDWDFVHGARALGASRWRIVLAHILPNIISPIVVYATLRFGVVILTEASLSFLGLGPSSPSPAWGLMVNEGLRLIRTAWWVAIMPGTAILFTVLAANLLGDALRDVLDPRTSQARTAPTARV